MKTPSSLVSTCLILAALPVSVHAANLFLDPASGTGYNMYSGPAPFPMASTDIWNSGNSVAANESAYGNSTGVLRFTDGTTATGVRVVTDGLSSHDPGSGIIYRYDFVQHSTSSAGNAGMTGLFGENPFDNSAWGDKPAGNEYGGVAARITGLAFGIYDIYMVGAYTGSTTAAHPGAGDSTAHQSVWAFASASITTLQTGTFGGPDDFLENDNNTAWTQGDNYARIRVTLDATNPALILVAEGDAVLSEDRGWLSAVQIIAIPEPSSALLLLGGLLPLLAARRR